MAEKQFPEVMNIKEAARYLRISERTVYKYVKKGLLPGRMIGNKLRFSRAALQKFLGEKG